MQRGNQADRKAPLEIKDLYMLNDKDKMSAAAEKFENYFATASRNYSSLTSNTTSTNRNNNLLVEFWQSPLTRAILKM